MAPAKRSARTLDSALFYRDHHIGGFDDRVGLGSFFKIEFLDRFVCDRGGYGFATVKFDFDVRGGGTFVNVLDRAFEKIARGYFHFIFPIDGDGILSGPSRATWIGGSSLPGR
jgi:hypothetical protein